MRGNMRYPRFLQPGGTIGFVAPSFGCATQPYLSAFQNAQKTFARMGYRLDLGPNCYAAEGIGISNEPIKCGAEINEYMDSDKNDVLISCGGGEMMCEILDHVDFVKIREGKPKWYMGFSDNTNLTFLIPTLCDTAAIYGPCAGAFGMEPWHESVKDAMDLLTGAKLSMRSYDLWEKAETKAEGEPGEEDPFKPYQVTEPVVMRCYCPDFPVGQDSCPNSEEGLRFTGRLLGGCMDCLVNLLGTSYDKVPEFVERHAGDGIVWFLESCDLNVFAIRRAVWQMQHAGWFSHVKGFLIGRPLCFGQEMMGLDQYHAVWDLLKGYGVPVIMDVDLGHLPPMMPLICGSMATVSYTGGDRQELKIDMELI